MPELVYPVQDGAVISAVRRYYQVGWPGTQECKHQFDGGEKGYLWQDGDWEIQDRFFVHQNGCSDGKLYAWYQTEFVFAMHYGGMYTKEQADWVRHKLLQPGPFEFLGLRGEPTRNLGNGFHYINRVTGNVRDFSAYEAICDISTRMAVGWHHIFGYMVPLQIN